MNGVGRRLPSAAMAAGTGIVLATSAWLTPAARGYGTHQQLGLGECSFLALSGLPCPMCGATTSFALMAHLHPVAAAVNQPFAASIFVAVSAIFAVSVAEAVDPRGRWDQLRDAVTPYEGRLAVAFLIAMGIAWGYKLATFGAAP